MIKFYITFFASLLFVTNYATDIYVNNSGQAGTYTNISAAISASSSGDRIFISPYGVYTEDLVVNKTVTLASAVSGTNFNVTGSCSVTANAGMDVRIIGGVFSGNLTASTNTATQNNMTDVYIIDSDFSTINLNQNFVRAHLLFCEALGNVDIQNGEIVGCSLTALDIEDGPNVGTGDTVKIIGNIISSSLDLNNDDNYFMIANNYFTNFVKFTNNYYNTNVNSIFINNTVACQYSGALIQFTNVNTINSSNVHFINNLFLNSQSYGGFTYADAFNANHRPKGYYNAHATHNGTTGGYGYFPVAGDTDLGDHGNASTIISELDDFGRCTNSSVVNKGMPSIEYYDIDMTINDIGTYGGPYSIDNYINTTNGKARIYDLDIPFEIWSGQTPTVKAKGAHTK